MQDGRWLILILTLDQDGPVAAILDPGDQARGGHMVPRAELLAEWSGRILLVQPALAVAAEVRPFGLAWFMPALRAQSGWLAGAFGRAFAGDPVSGAGGLQGGVVVQGKGGGSPQFKAASAAVTWGTSRVVGGHAVMR